jgi:hypothetical protein
VCSHPAQPQLKINKNRGLVVSPITPVTFATGILEQRPWHFHWSRNWTAPQQLQLQQHPQRQGSNDTTFANVNDQDQSEKFVEQQVAQEGRAIDLFASIFEPGDLALLIGDALEAVPDLSSLVRWKPSSDEDKRAREPVRTSDGAGISASTTTVAERPPPRTVESALAVVADGHSLMLGLENFPCRRPG